MNEAKRRYRLERYQKRVDDFYHDEDFKSIREEIAVCRMILEEILRKCEGVGDFIMHADQITKIVDQINRLVSSMHKIEIQTGQLLNRSKITSIADRIVGILATRVTDDVLKAVSGEILEAIDTGAMLLDAPKEWASA